MNGEDLVRFSKWREGLDAVVILATAVVIFLGVRKQFHEGRFQPEEDMSGAVRYLRMNVGPPIWCWCTRPFRKASCCTPQYRAGLRSP